GSNTIDDLKHEVIKANPHKLKCDPLDLDVYEGDGSGTWSPVAENAMIVDNKTDDADFGKIEYRIVAKLQDFGSGVDAFAIPSRLDVNAVLGKFGTLVVRHILTGNTASCDLKQFAMYCLVKLLDKRNAL